MNKNDFAKTPPMGWNSWDCYGASVTEKELKQNADYMAEHLKKYGWEYIICDIQWYEPTADSSHYHKFADLCMDEYGRLIPAENRFPSAAGGKGFREIADYIHGKGLKFGIHIMRGIPRQAVAKNVTIKGTSYTARQVAHPASICCWNSDMYGVDSTQPGAQEYYDSILELYASWGVDYIKVDDICVKYGRINDEGTLQYGGDEIEMLHRAIEKCGRSIVLSLSPGPAKIEEAWHYEKYANMWRITDDFWDRWDLLLPMFWRCELWQNHVSEGCYPDCDMLTLGKLGKGFGHEWECNFSHDEQITLMTLWSIFRSPLMLGADLLQLDDWTKKLITNKDVLGLLKHSEGARQIERDDEHVIWCSKDTEDGSYYVAVFNLKEQNCDVAIPWEDVKNYGVTGTKAVELWNHEDVDLIDKDSVFVASHGAKLFKIQ